MTGQCQCLAGARGTQCENGKNTRMILCCDDDDDDEDDEDEDDDVSND